MQEIEKKSNLNILFMFLVPVARVLQLVDMLVRSFISITIKLFLSKEICSCQQNFIPVAALFLLLLLSFIKGLGDI